jgi:hypothetical protein
MASRAIPSAFSSRRAPGVDAPQLGDADRPPVSSPLALRGVGLTLIFSTILGPDSLLALVLYIAGIAGIVVISQSGH